MFTADAYVNMSHGGSSSSHVFWDYYIRVLLLETPSSICYSLSVESAIITQTVSFIKIGPKHHSSIMIMFFVVEATVSLFILDFTLTQPTDLKGILKSFIPLCGFKNVSGRFDSPNIKNDFIKYLSYCAVLNVLQQKKKGTTASD